MKKNFFTVEVAGRSHINSYTRRQVSNFKASTVIEGGNQYTLEGFEERESNGPRGQEPKDYAGFAWEAPPSS